MLNTKSSFAVLFLGLAGLTASSAQAQQLLNASLVPNPYSTSKTLNGYQPSVIATEQDAKKVYDSMPTSIFKGSSGCFERAHNWAFGLNQSNGIKSMKVFLFFTERYKREFDYEWMYHVAPLIPVKKLDGTIEEMVFDPTFTSAPSWVNTANQSKYDNKPIPVAEWIKYFIFPDVQCKEIQDISEYMLEDGSPNMGGHEQQYCYIMKAPMYNYIPANFYQDPIFVGKNDPKKPEEWLIFNRDTGTRNGWTRENLDFMKKGLRAQ